MRATAIFTLLLAGLVSGQERNQFTILNTRTLADGREFQSIQEHAEDLPELPTVQSEVSPQRLVQEEDEEVMVPVDEQGKVLPGYEHLLDPKVIVIPKLQLARLNNSKPTNVQSPPSAGDGILITEEGPIEPYPPNENIPQMPPVPVSRDPSEVGDGETAGSDYDEAFVPESILPSIQDYVDSKEKDPEVETGENGLTEKELEKIEEEIEEKKEDEQKQQEDPKKEASDVMEDIMVIVKEAEKEQAQEEEKTLVKEISDIVMDDKKGDVVENEQGEMENTGDTVLVAAKPSEPGEKSYILEQSSLEEPEPRQEEDRRPSRLHKGEIIGRRRQPDSARSQLVVSLILVYSLLFL